MRRHPRGKPARGGRGTGRAAILLAVLLSVGACGSRGDPLPPLRPLPPPLLDVRVAQRGTDAVLRFTAPPPVVSVEGLEVALARIEVLVLTERYPVIGPEILASSLEGERRERLQAAREAAERAERTLARQRGEEVEEPTAEEGERTLSPEEELLRRVPSDVRMAWRENEEVLAPVILESARRLDKAVDLLWVELGLPTAIIDQRRPPELPDPMRVIEAAERVSRSLSYEGRKEPDVFLEGAAVVATIPIEDLDEYRVEDDLQIVHAVGAPPQSDVRTRYFFAVRTVSVRGQPGEIQRIAALAPAAVPTAPNAVSASVIEPGVQLTWDAPVADISGTLIGPEQVRYNVYRKRASEASFPGRPLNPLPLELAEYTDTEVTWDESYIYEVRALNAPLEDQEEGTPAAVPATDTPAEQAASEGPLKESFGRQSAELDVVDTFPPPAVFGLQAVRAARTVTLRWNEVTASDLAGYRVYRHQAPAPEIPGLPAKPQERVGDDLAAAAVEEGAEAAEEASEQEAGQAEETQEQAGQAEEAQEQVGQEEAAQEAADQETDGQQRQPRQRRRNLLVAAGWELLTAVAVTEPRFIDPSADPAVEWVYVVEAVDESGNPGPPTVVTIAPPQDGRR